MKKKLFEKAAIGARQTPNRLAAQAMEGCDGINGAPSGRSLARYEELAQGGWGIVFTEAISVVSESLARRNGFIIDESRLESYKELVRRFKKANPDSLLLFQITHSGMKSGDFSRKRSAYLPEYFLSDSELQQIRDAFLKGAQLAEEAGADGVDLKSCHGYLGGELLRPANQRSGPYGGSYENRTRFMREIHQGAVANRKTPGFLIGSRLSWYEGIRGGCGTGAQDELVEDFSEMARLLKDMRAWGSDYVNISAGIPGLTSEITRPTPGSKWFYLQQFRYAKLAREAAGGMPVIGSAYSILQEQGVQDAEDNLQKGYADFIGYGRQIFADPLFPVKLQQGEKPFYCTGCSMCAKLMLNHKQSGCVFRDPSLKKQLQEIKAHV